MGNAYRSVLALKPTGDAVPTNVLAGKTFSNADGTGKTGTMVNNGAVSVTLTDQDPTYTIPEGYHNGFGIVGFTSSGGDGADLVVNCDSVFAGATVICTDGNVTFQGVCPLSSPYEVVFESIPIGTWTISASYSGYSYSTSVTIIDFTATLAAIPEGSTITPTDDIQTWLHCANIWDKNYTAISEIIADTTTLQALIADNNAVDYMVRSTTWASNVTADSNSMTYIGLNDYCSDALLSNTVWLNSICNSAFFENVLNIKVPTMTSDTTPSGRVIYSGQSSSYPKYYAFDGNVSTLAIVPSAVQDKTIGYEFTEAVNVRKVNHYSNNTNYKGLGTDAILQYSDDGSTWYGNYNVGGSADNLEHNIVIEDDLGAHFFWRISNNRDWSLSTLQFYGRA